ncbi:MAG: GatB/YqeY domain-containing protein [Hyphomonadaceae bacterium]|nr:GatB/YqeY domain-containing protein [Hyphomonadaceae bacterium]
MGQLDQTVQVTLRNRINLALSKAESADTNSVEAQTLRLIKCAMDDRDVIARSRGECSGCDNEVIVDLLETMAAQRETSIKQYDENGRIADAEREREELEIISGFLPKPLAGEALETAAAEVVNQLQARKLKDVGRCMSALREKFPGQIECGPASKAVRAAIG